MERSLKSQVTYLVESVNPYWVILVGVFSISCSAIFVKFAAAPPIVTAFYRMLFTVMILTPFVLGPLRHNTRFIQLTTKQLVISSLSGVFLSLHFACWITSLDYTSITSSTVLVTLQPLFVMVGGYLFYQESIGHRATIGALMSVCGGIVLGYGDMDFGSNALYGDILALAGAIFLACYLLIGRNMRKQLDVLSYTYIVYVSAAIVLFLGNIVLTKQPLTGYPSSTWGWFIGMAVVPNIFGHSIFNWALKYTKAAVVSVSVLGEPVGATILAFIIWGQLPGVLQIVGGLFIIVGLAIFILYSQNGNSRSL